MPEEALILKRNPDAEYSESYNVLFEGRYVGRIYKAVSHAPREAPWFWGLEFHEWQGSDGPHYGHVASLEAAKQAFRAAWARRPKAHGKARSPSRHNRYLRSRNRCS